MSVCESLQVTEKKKKEKKKMCRRPTTNLVVLALSYLTVPWPVAASYLATSKYTLKTIAEY